MTCSQFEDLIHAINGVRKAIEHSQRSECRLVTTEDLEKVESKIMAKLDDFFASLETHQKTQEEGIDAVVASVQNIAQDVADLKKQIEDFQKSPGDLTPENEAAMARIQAKAEGLSAKTDKLKIQSASLDEATPPTPPA